ncbi:glycoside hydrolase family 15 protein [Haladaptatus halobius]|uniref:glycoside hydrolase family 15 protein n=1 Tax=Haladaptatus halobius TaxID=2884875 RepID=UPI001D0A10DF|nr:glycoside hydrolase family 15 protein [Haladaptatus halobius]
MTSTHSIDHESQSQPPLEAYGIIGNLETCAHVSREGSIDWCCFPAVDSSSVFTKILDWDDGGSWCIQPATEFSSKHVYLEDTNVLKTTFETDVGRVSLTDFMPVVDHSYNTNTPPRAIYRRISGEAGTVDLTVECSPVIDYARAMPDVKHEGTAVIVDHPDQLVLSSMPSVSLKRNVATASLSIDAGEDRWFVLEYGSTDPTDGISHQDVLDETIEYWRDWAHLENETVFQRALLEGPWREYVIRSSLVLKLLISNETQAICAAPTTSLPEEIGGVRNWDYRYNWLRDSAFTTQALYKTGHKQEARAYLDWFIELCDEYDPETLQPMYGLRGEPVPDEEVLDHLSGYRGSTPVRTGNAAKEQRQLDMYGEIVEAVYETSRRGEMLRPSDWCAIRTLVEYVCRIWDEPDSGIWEVRSDPQHFVYSKVMCWVALDRAIEITETTRFDGPVDRWREERSAIKRAVLKRGYNESMGSFIRSFDEQSKLDATGLLIPLTGFLPFEDERVQGTIETTMQRLVTDNGLVQRYEGRDGVAGDEGAFLLCSFWLIDALALSGRTEEAVSIFENVLSFTNPLGLLSEEIDPSTGMHLGNTPQAFSHIGLINSALYIESVRREAVPEPIPRGAAGSDVLEGTASSRDQTSER